MTRNSVSSSDKEKEGVSNSDSLVKVDLEKLGPDGKSLPQLQSHILTPFLLKKVPRVPEASEKKVWPQSLRNIFSYVFFWWLVPVMNVGYKRTLENNDLWTLKEDMKVKVLTERFKKHLAANIESNRKKAKRANPNITPEELEQAGYTKITLPWALLKTLKWKYGAAIVCKLTYDIISSLNPLLTKALITYVEKKTFDPDLSLRQGVGYALGVSFMTLVSGIIINHFMNFSMTCGLQVKAILTSVILEKSFKLDGHSKQTYSTGKITSLMGTDLARVDLAVGFQPYLLTFPIPIGIIIALLIVNIGPVALVGIGLFLVFVGIIGYLSKNLVTFRKKASLSTDARVGLVREVLNSIKMIKYYGWEVPYHNSITEKRQAEMKVVFNLQLYRVLFTGLAISMPTICSVVTFLALHAVHPNKSAADIFASVTLFSALSTQVMMVPLALGTSIDAFIGLQRVMDFLKASEETAPDEAAEKQQEQELHFTHDPNAAIELLHSEFRWDVVEVDNDGSSPEKPAESLHRTVTNVSRYSKYSKSIDIVDPSSFTGLHDISFSLRKGEFVIITGSIGSGKTSLLNAMAGFMKKESGIMKINEPLLLCGYPWVQNATVKDNVLFGKPLDAKRYQRVIHACSLDSDLSILPAGDMTEVGERGITLSGGQKARINLARAVYAGTSTILLDDVLSAVDARVGKHIMEDCIMGVLKDCTRVLATHQLSSIQYADRVIYLTNDGKAVIGTAAELQALSAEFRQLMEYNSKAEEEEEDEEEGELLEEDPELALQKNPTKVDEEDLDYDFQDKTGDGQLIGKEEKAVNKIKWHIYKEYFSMGAGRFPVLMFLLLFSLFVTSTFVQLFTNTWLSFWTDNKFKGRSSQFYIGLYCMFCFLGVFMILGQFTLLTFITNRAARKINLRAVQKVLYTPMSFLDTTPMGRILNRFTKDTDSLDNEIGDQLRLFFYPTCYVIGVLILAIIYLPWIAIAIPVVMFLFVSITSFYQASAREVKRLEAVNRSLVYNNFNECLSGMATIKAYKLQGDFIETNDSHVDGMNEAYYINVSIQRFLAIHFDMVAFAFIVIIAMLCVTRLFKISAASAGLVLSYVLSVVGILSMLVRSLTQVENEMNSAERLIFYGNDLPQEKAYEIPETKPAESWPEHGQIEFKDVSLRYREGLPLVLKNISLSIKPGEKIGICGRTGAGKSSIMTALYRLAELDKGQILIDGVDISTLGMKDLRTNLCIIPQDPVLFKGSIRKNLDPFGYASDDQLWDGLRRSGLVDQAHLPTIKKQVLVDNSLDSLHKFHLDQQVEEEGSNFSLGERQLLALARALVKDSQILILDEATSSVDYETDANINRTIRTEFKHCTILCIAHRLNTIVKFDRILVLDKGEVEEFGTPSELYEQDGIFKEMCSRLQITQEDFKKDIEEDD